MGQDGAWAGHPEIYAAAMCYKVDVTIYSKDYEEIGGSLVIMDAGVTENVERDRPMIHISYHDNNHFNSVRPPISRQSNGPGFVTATERLEADMERALKDHQDEVGHAIATNTTENDYTLPEDKIKPIRENSCKIMSYIAHQLSAADGRCVYEAQLKESRDQAEVRALRTAQYAEEAPTLPSDPSLISALSPLQSMVAQYEADLNNIISKHRDGIESILREISPTKENSTLLASRYDKLRSTNLPIMTALANLITHLGGKEIPHAALIICANRAEEEALLLYKSYAAPMVLPPNSALENPAMIVEEEMTPKAPDNEFLVLPPTKTKASLKPSKFFPVFVDQTPPRIAGDHMKDDEDDASEPGVYSKLDEGVGDGTHYITASFVKTN